MARSFACGTEGGRGAGVSLTAGWAGFAPGFVGTVGFPVAAVGFPVVGVGFPWLALAGDLVGGSGRGFPDPFAAPFFSGLGLGLAPVAAVRDVPLTAGETARTGAGRGAGFAGRVTFAADLAGFFATGLATT